MLFFLQGVDDGSPMDFFFWSWCLVSLGVFDLQVDLWGECFGVLGGY